jgi:hypothetical protein
VAYTAEKPRLTPSPSELRERIPGWGVDLDPKNRPAVPKEDFNPAATGAHWEFPERQPERVPRERSIEHKFLTPVFGTSCPLKGVSGMIRRFAYRYSEGQSAHWLLLMFADRVDVAESRIEAVLKGQPDNLVTETGVQAEFTHGGFRSRVGQGRADLKHQPIDLLLTAGAWVALAGAVYGVSRVIARQQRA